MWHNGIQTNIDWHSRTQTTRGQQRATRTLTSCPCDTGGWKALGGDSHGHWVSWVVSITRCLPPRESSELNDTGGHSLSDDYHWMETIMSDKDHWSLIIDTQWRPSRVMMASHGTCLDTCHGCRLTHRWLPLGDGSPLGWKVTGWRISLSDGRPLAHLRRLTAGMVVTITDHWRSPTITDDQHPMLPVMVIDYRPWWLAPSDANNHGWWLSPDDEDGYHLMRIIVSFTGWWHSPSGDHHLLSAISGSYHPLMEIVDWWLTLNNEYHDEWVSWVGEYHEWVSIMVGEYHGGWISWVVSITIGE